MIVVADSTPLHYLILLDLTQLLPEFYGDVLIPTTVAAELRTLTLRRKLKIGWLTLRLGSESKQCLTATGDQFPSSLVSNLRATNFYVDETLIHLVLGDWLGDDTERFGGGGGS